MLRPVKVSRTENQQTSKLTTVACEMWLWACMSAILIMQYHCVMKYMSRYSAPPANTEEVEWTETSAPQNNRFGDLLGIDCIKQSPVCLVSMFVNNKLVYCLHRRLHLMIWPIRRLIGYTCVILSCPDSVQMNPACPSAHNITQPAHISQSSSWHSRAVARQLARRHRDQSIKTQYSKLLAILKQSQRCACALAWVAWQIRSDHHGRLCPRYSECHCVTYM